MVACGVYTRGWNYFSLSSPRLHTVICPFGAHSHRLFQPHHQTPKDRLSSCSSSLHLEHKHLRHGDEKRHGPPVTALRLCLFDVKLALPFFLLFFFPPAFIPFSCFCSQDSLWWGCRIIITQGSRRINPRNLVSRLLESDHVTCRKCSVGS